MTYAVNESIIGKLEEEFEEELVEPSGSPLQLNESKSKSNLTNLTNNTLLILNDLRYLKLQLNESKSNLTNDTLLKTNNILNKMKPIADTQLRINDLLNRILAEKLLP